MGFYTLSAERQLQYLIELDMNTDTITGISAASNGRVKLSRKQALRILEALDATADQESAFADVGAFGPYRFGQKPDAQECLEVNGRLYRVDAFAAHPAQVVVRERMQRRRRGRWSLFQRDEASPGKGLAEWDEVYCGGIELCQFAVLLQQPKVADMISSLFD